MHVAELNRMGAKIKTKGNKAFIEGNTKFKSAELMATDLRASVSLILAGLMAKGKTTINRIYHLDRGYEDLEKKLKSLNTGKETLDSNDEYEKKILSQSGLLSVKPRIEVEFEHCSKSEIEEN